MRFRMILNARDNRMQKVFSAFGKGEVCLYSYGDGVTAAL